MSSLQEFMFHADQSTLAYDLEETGKVPADFT